MPRNVVRSLSRPCARVQWRPAYSQNGIRRWYSENGELDSQKSELTKASIVDDPDLSIHVLRVADQKYLAETRAKTEEFVREVNRIKEDVASLPVTVQVIPEIPAYSLGRTREIYREDIPHLADRTINAAEHVREHIIDLQYERYNDRDDNPLRRFEKKTESWTEEEKRARLHEMKMKDEAMLARLNRNSEETYNDVTATIARHMRLKGAPKAPMPSFGEASIDLYGADERSFKDASQIETSIKTEGKGEQSWDALRRDPRSKVESRGWKDAEPTWSTPIRQTRTGAKDSANNGQEKAEKKSSERSKSDTVKELQEAIANRESERTVVKEERQEAEASAKEDSAFRELKDSLASDVTSSKK